MAEVEPRRALGRGLAALIGDANSEVSVIERARTQRRIPIEFLRRNPRNPRTSFAPDDLEELTSSVREKGIVQPILVRPVPNEANAYEIIAGERRWRAAQLAGLHQVPVLLKVVDDETALALALIENIQREDLNAMEEAVALVRLQDEFGLNQQQVATAVGKSRAAVANLMRLVKLAPEVQELLARGDLEMGHARALLPLPAGDQLVAARRVVAGGLTVRQTETLARKWQLPETRSIAVRPDADIARLEEDLSNRLGTTVAVRHGSSGNGRLVIHYTNLEVLEGILERIR